MRRILLICGLIIAAALSGCDGGGSSDSSPSEPVAPSAVMANAVSSVEAGISWTASEGSDVASYTVYRDGASVGTTAETAFTDTGLAAGATYCYTVATSDTSGNLSAQSTESCTTTVAAQTVNVTIETVLGGYEFTTDMDTFSVGYTYSFVITNNDSTLHEWMIMPRGSTDETQALVIAENIAGGASVTSEYTFVPVTGDYEFACHIANHYQLGLHYNITIVP